MPSNLEFLTAIFGEDTPWVHVTSFIYDPSNIPNDKHLNAWKGNFFSRTALPANTNQYFTISNFYVGENNTARRRKSLYRHTNVIVLDDVREKLTIDQVSKLPAPSYILETSLGSEQWGFILDTPCTVRHRVENLLDGLVANGLAPGGRDPGMKGVTRYVRLPEGVNNKHSKLVDGLPFKCNLKLWQPERTVTIEQLAVPFNVNLDAQRRESRVDGASNVDDHPLLHLPDIIRIKSERSNGRFDIVCPWVDEHTGNDDSGAGVFTNSDGTIGFKCHHGACQNRTGKNLLQFIEGECNGFNEQLKSWQFKRVMSQIPVAVNNQLSSFLKPDTEVSFLKPDTEVSFLKPDTEVSFLKPQGVDSSATEINSIQSLTDALKKCHPDSDESKQLVTNLLKIVDTLPKIDQVGWHNQICDIMRWTKPNLKTILNEMRGEWYSQSKSAHTFYNDVMFVKDLNQFYDWKCRLFFTPDAFQNAFAHMDPDARRTALQDGNVMKVDKLDYAPGAARVFTEGHTTYGNIYYESDRCTGVAGDCDKWLEHWDQLGWSEHRDHMLKWMAYTLIHPEHKINHMLILGSAEGCGKDFLLYPLMNAMGDNAEVISGDELLSDHNDFLLGTKYLNINETDLGSRREAMIISNRIKPYASAPPDTLRVNPKNIRPIRVRNIVNGTMTTNSHLPIQVSGVSRRFYTAWSLLNVRDENEEMTPEWREYWNVNWGWMKSGGVDACIYYLRNCVDISNFNPHEAPPMTDFLREIREASKSPMEQTIEAFIINRIGAFANDLLTSTDASNTLRGVDLFNTENTHEFMFTDSKLFTPTRVGQVMKSMHQCNQHRASKGASHTRLWSIRNVSTYMRMTHGQLYERYKAQSTGKVIGIMELVK